MPSAKEKDTRRKAAYDLEERLLAYAVRVVRLVDSLPRSRGADHLGGQLLRSGTSPALNHGEAQAAESLNDFIHKMKICLKELRESRRTLRIIGAVPLAREQDVVAEVDALTIETEELIRIFYSAIRTASARRADDRETSTRVREETSTYRDPADVSGDSSPIFTGDPVSGVQPWMLDVGCWTLDVDRRSSGSVGIPTDSEQEEASR